jgi:hypothetical protein
METIMGYWYPATSSKKCLDIDKYKLYFPPNHILEKSAKMVFSKNDKKKGEKLLKEQRQCFEILEKLDNRRLYFIKEIKGRNRFYGKVMTPVKFNNNHLYRFIGNICICTTSKRLSTPYYKFRKKEVRIRKKMSLLWRILEEILKDLRKINIDSAVELEFVPDSDDASSSDDDASSSDDDGYSSIDSYGFSEASSAWTDDGED